MTLQQFQSDEQFQRLVRRESGIDLVVASLELARDGQPDLDFGPTLSRLRQCVSSLTRPVAMAGADISELNLLIAYLTDELNLHGDYDCYECPDSSYLNRVLETGRGIPITLSIVYMAVANELGIPLQGVAAPAHFLTRLETDHGALFIDPFRRGYLMQEDECLNWLSELTELPVSRIRPSLEPVSERAIVIRMLNNLKMLFGSRSQWAAAWRVQSRLVMLMPGSYREQRDLAILCLRAGRAGEAVTRLNRCLDVCADEEREMLDGYLSEARRGVPLLN